MTLCTCGCGQEIIIQPHHKYYGTPKIIKGHYKPTEETKRKISISSKGKIISSEQKNKISESVKKNYQIKENYGFRARKNRTCSEETKVKMRLKHIGKPSPMKGKKHTEESLQLMSKKHITNGFGIYRRIAFELFPRECNRCFSQRRLIVHHKDRNNRNNIIQNLEVLCYSCHAKEHKTGRGRKHE